MRAGKLKTRRYKTRKGGWRYLAILAVGIALGAAVLSLRERVGPLSLPAPFVTVPLSPTRAPEELRQEERTLTLPGQTWYALQLGAFDSPEAAQSLAASFQSRGAGGYVLRQGNFLVLAAAYSTRAEAQAVVNQLKNQHQVDAAVTDILQPEVTLLLSGQQGQLTALEDACGALDRLAEHLSVLSAGLDQRILGADQLLPALRSERDTLQALSVRLTEWFGPSCPDEISPVKRLLDDLTVSLDACLSASGGTALGAAVKYAQLQCICRMAAYAAAFAP